MKYDVIKNPNPDGVLKKRADLYHGGKDLLQLRIGVVQSNIFGRRCLVCPTSLDLNIIEVKYDYETKVKDEVRTETERLVVCRACYPDIKR